MKKPYAPFDESLSRRAIRQARNADGTFRRTKRNGPARAAQKGKSPTAHFSLSRLLKMALSELREILWPSDSKQMGIKRGYRI